MAQLIPRTPGPQVQLQQGPQVRNTARVDLSPLERTVGVVGKVAGDFAQQQKDKADLTAVMQARRELSEWEGSTFNPANADGIAKYQGKNALQAHDALLGDLDTRVNDIRSRLSADQQQRFDQVAFSFRDSVQGRLNSYADREYSAYEAAEHKATIENIGQDAVSAGMSGDFGLADTRLQEAIGIASASYQAQGLGAEAIKASERGIVSSVRKQTAAAMATRDPFAAEDYYHRYADQMTPEDRAQVERTLYPVVKDRAAYELAQSLADGRGAAEPLPAPAARGVPSAAVAKAIDDAAAAEGLDAAGRADLYALAEQESGFRADAVNKEVLDDGDQATGLFQYRATSAGGIDRKDATASARRAAREYRERLAKGGRAFAIAAHFAGEGGADAVVNRGRSAQNPKTALYVRQVMGRSARWASQGGQGSGVTTSVAAARSVPTTFAEAASAIPRDTPPDLRIAAEGYLRDIIAQRKDRTEQAKKQAAMSIYDKVTAAGASVPLSQVLAPAELALVGQDSSLSESINRYRKLISEGVVIEDDPATLDRLHRMQALQPSEFARLALGQYADRLSGKTLKALAEDQTKANDPTKRADYMSESDRVNSGFRMVGLDPAGDPAGKGGKDAKEARERQRGEFRIAYQNALTARTQEAGKKPSPTEADALVRAVARQFAERQQTGSVALWSQDGLTARLLPGGTDIYSRAAGAELQFSEADRQAFITAYRSRYQRTPTDAEVTQGVYKQMQARRSGAREQ
jgi:hypothetical protein